MSAIGILSNRVDLLRSTPRSPTLSLNAHRPHPQSAGFTLVELLVVMLVVALMSSALVVTALPGASSQVQALARELEQRLTTVQQQAVISGRNYGLLIDGDRKLIEVLVYAPEDGAGVQAALEASTDENKSAEQIGAMLMDVFGLKYQPASWSWQNQDQIGAMQFPQDINFEEIANAASELSRQMAAIAKPKPSLLSEMLGTEEELPEQLEPSVLFSANGSIQPLSTFTIQMESEVELVWWDDQGVIHRGQP